MKTSQSRGSQKNCRLRITKAYKLMERLFDVIPPNELREILGPSFELFHGSGQVLRVESPSMLQSCLSLLRHNMKGMYDESQFQLEGVDTPGWHDEPKWDELVDPEAYHIIIKTTSPPRSEQLPQENIQKNISGGNVHAVPNGVVGFVHLRFVSSDDDDETSPVLYVYEIQLDKSLQGKGIGFALMEYLERVSTTANMDGIKLTVQRGNSSALDFYRRKCGFTICFSSPDYDELEWVPSSK